MCERPRASRGKAGKKAAHLGSDLARRPVGDHLSVGHHDHAVGVSVGLLEVVGREDDRLAARGESPHQGPEPTARLDVDADRRLVEDQHGRIGDQREGEAHTLGLPARQLLGSAVGDLRQSVR